MGIGDWGLGIGGLGLGVGGGCHEAKDQTPEPHNPNPG